MKKSTKGALAAAAAGSLLLGGAGSLAFWTDAATISGSDIDSGHLSLVTDTTDCDTTWMLNGTTDPYVAQILSPGDTLTRHCSYSVSMSGDNLSADLSISAPGFDGTGDAALRSDMTVDGDFTYDDGGAGPVDATGTITDIADGSVVDALITVSFNDVNIENNDSNTGADLAAALDDTTVTITQS